MIYKQNKIKILLTFKIVAHNKKPILKQICAAPHLKILFSGSVTQSHIEGLK